MFESTLYNVCVETAVVRLILSQRSAAFGLLMLVARASDLQ